MIDELEARLLQLKGMLDQLMAAVAAAEAQLVEKRRELAELASEHTESPPGHEVR